MNCLGITVTEQKQNNSWTDILTWNFLILCRRWSSRGPRCLTQHKTSKFSPAINQVLLLCLQQGLSLVLGIEGSDLFI